MRRTLLFASLMLIGIATAVAQEDTGATYRRAMELYRAGKYEQALPLFKKSLDQAEARYGEQSPLLALDLNNLAEIYRLLGRYDEAEPLYKRAIRLDEAAGPDSPGLATSLNNLALLYRAQKRYQDAEPLYQRSLALLERSLGPDHPDVAKGLNNLAMLYRLEGEPEEARPLQARALAIAEKQLGPEHPTTKLMKRNLDLVGGPAPEDAVVSAAVEAPATAAKGKRDAAPARNTAALAKPNGAMALPPPPDLRRRPGAAPPPGTTAALAPAKPAGPAVDGRYAIHVASVHDPASIPGEWKRLVKLHPSLAGLPLRPPQSVEIPGKGVFYRVVLGSFAAKAEAQASCDRLKAEKAYCAVIAP